MNREPSFSAEGDPAIGGIELGTWGAVLPNAQTKYVRRIVARGGGHFGLLRTAMKPLHAYLVNALGIQTHLRSSIYVDII